MAQTAVLMIKTIIRQPGTEEDAIELSLPAVVYEKDNSCFIIYEETDADGGAGITSRIRLSKDRMKITRSGQVNSTMELTEGEDTTADYRTPYGLLRMNIHTDTLQISRLSSGLEVKAEYVLSAEAGVISRNEMMLTAQFQET